MDTKRQTIILLIMISVLATTVVVSTSYAQGGNSDNLRDYILKNQELLDQATELVRGTNSSKARASLETARQLHQASIKQMESSSLVVSAQLAKRAREAIQKTIQLAKRDSKLEERAHQAIEHAGRKNEQARTLFDEVGAGDNVPAKKLIDESLNQLLRARSNVREHMFEVAIQSANASFDMSARAIRLLKRDSVGPELVRREIARTDRLLDRIDERAQGINNPDLLRLIDEAHGLQSRARANGSEGRYLMAFEETKRARSLARRIINRAGGTLEANEETAARTLELTDKMIEQAYQVARENGDERAVQQLDEARRIQQNALDEYRNRNYDRALTLTRRAREIARNTMRAMNADIDEESVRQTLERTDEILERLRAALGAGDDETAAGLFDRASERQATAWNSFNKGDTKKALANTKVARNLANNALRQLENGRN
jgi:hypothetical protein